MTTPDITTVHTALEIACRAPSVHNTQPWRWALAPHSVHLFADRSRQLPVIDQDGRDLTVSCGAALHHARRPPSIGGIVPGGGPWHRTSWVWSGRPAHGEHRVALTPDTVAKVADLSRRPSAYAISQLTAPNQSPSTLRKRP